MSEIIIFMPVIKKNLTAHLMENTDVNYVAGPPLLPVEPDIPVEALSSQRPRAGEFIRTVLFLMVLNTHLHELYFQSALYNSST